MYVVQSLIILLNDPQGRLLLVLFGLSVLYASITIWGLLNSREELLRGRTEEHRELRQVQEDNVKGPVRHREKLCVLREYRDKKRQRMEAESKSKTEI
jgi:hypothetical protein